MNRRDMLKSSAVTTMGLAVLPRAAAGQTKTLNDRLIGAWVMTSNVTTRADGTKADTFGPDAKGIVFFESNGRHALIITRSDMPKFVSNNRTTGTAEENTAVVQGSVVYFGTYSVDDEKTYSIEIDGTTFPNWQGAKQKRNYALAGDELTMSSGAGSGGGSIVSIWKRT